MIYKTLHRRTDNTMINRKRTNNNLQNITQKDRQYNGQKINDNRSTDNTMKYRQYNGQKINDNRSTDNTMAKR